MWWLEESNFYTTITTKIRPTFLLSASLISETSKTSSDVYCCCEKYNDSHEPLYWQYELFNLKHE